MTRYPERVVKALGLSVNDRVYLHAPVPGGREAHPGYIDALDGQRIGIRGRVGESARKVAEARDRAGDSGPLRAVQAKERESWCAGTDRDIVVEQSEGKPVGTDG